MPSHPPDVVPRYLEQAIRDDALASGRMAFISGPRQAGKTTLGRRLLASPQNEYTWDDPRFRIRWSKDPMGAVTDRHEGPILLDEIHKDRRWKARLKGLYDLRGRELPIVVTGSARLDLNRRGGDSLLGRYIPYRLHGFSVGESAHPPGPDAILGTSKAVHRLEDLLRLGCFPEPLLAGSEAHARRWSRLRAERLLREDVRDLRNVHDLQAMRVLADLLPERVGSLLSMNALREHVAVAYATVRDWIATLEALYYHFLVRPWAGRLNRTLRAAPKLYLHDFLPIDSRPARLENLTAHHLHKACQFWTDTAAGEIELRFLRRRRRRRWTSSWSGGGARGCSSSASPRSWSRRRRWRSSPYAWGRR